MRCRTSDVLVGDDVDIDLRPSPCPSRNPRQNLALDLLRKGGVEYRGVPLRPESSGSSEFPTTTTVSLVHRHWTT